MKLKRYRGDFLKLRQKGSSVIVWFILLTLVVMIVLPVMSNFQKLDQNEILNQRLLWLIGYYSVLIFLGCYAFYSYGLWRLATDRYSIYLLLCLLSFLVSILMGGANFRPMMFLAPFFTVLTFHVFKKQKAKEFSIIVTMLLIIFLLTPMLLFFFPALYDIPFDMYIVDSFRGFASSRTTYGYLAGIAILILTVRPFPLRWIIILLLFMGLILSESRAAILSIIVSIVYLVIFDQRKKRIFRIGMIIFIFTSFSLVGYQGKKYQQRHVSMFEDSGERIQIIKVSIEKSFDNIFFGEGMFYQNVDVGYQVEPHNSIMQSIINFGVIPTLFWLLMIGKTFFSVHITGRAFFLYWFIFGMFQPGFDAFLFVPESFFALLLGVYFGSSSIPSRKKYLMSPLQS